MNVEQVVSRAVSVAVAAAFLAFGLRGLVSGRPLLVPARWSVVLFGLVFLKLLIPLGGDAASSSGDADVSLPLLPLLYGGVLVVLWFHFKGYVVFGATEPILRNALRRTLDARGLSHEDRPDAIHIPSEQLDVQLHFNALGGTAHMKAIQDGGRPLLGDLVRDLNVFFESHPIELRERAFAVYTFICALLVAVALLYSR